MKFVVVGLGKMGMQIVERACAAGFSVIALDSNEAAKQRAESLGSYAASGREDAVAQFQGEERVIVWLMIPAAAVEAETLAWMEVLSEGSLLVDGGNSDFRHTKNRAEKLAQKNIDMVDVGVSGGILGEKNGFSMMAGGDEEGYRTITPLLDALAKPHGGHRYFGEHGSGHFVKMVHNAIEYGMMESLAEGYEVLKEGPYKHLDLAAVGEVWQASSVITSNLNGLVAEIMHEDQDLGGVSGYVAESGEARWTLEVAKSAGIEMPGVQAAFNVRVESEKGKVNYTTKLLAKLRNKFGGHAVNKLEK